MASHIHQPAANKLVLYSLLLMMLLIGFSGPMLQTLDDDENLGITFVEAKIVGHNDVGRIAHLTPVNVLIVVHLFHLDFDFEDVFQPLQSCRSAKLVPALLATPLRT
jgi:hypothetical protein